MAQIVSSHEQPIYLRIRRKIEERIDRSEYPAGSVLPSENELADEFGTTRLTVRNAMDALVERGCIRRVQGKGAFVSSHNISHTSVPQGGFRKVAEALGMEPSVRLLASGRRKAGAYYGWLFGIPEDDLLYSLRRLNSLDGQPVALENTLIPLSLLPTIEDVDIQVFSLYETYELLGHKVARVQEKLDVLALTAREAGLLHVDAGDVAMVSEGVSYDISGNAIEYARNISRADFAGYTFKF